MKEVFIVSIAKYYKQGIIFLKGILLAKLLTLEEYGIYNLFLMFLTFSTCMSLGATYAVNKQLSINRDNKQLSKLIINRSNLIIIIGNSIFFLIFILIALNMDTYFGWGILIIYLIMVFVQYNTFYENILRSLEEFNKISLGLFLVATIDIILLFLIVIINDSGSNILLILFVYLFAVIVTNIYYKINFKKFIKISFSFQELKNTLKDIIGLYKHLILGISLLLYNLNYLLFVNADKIIISIFYGMKDLGVYGFSTNIVTGTTVVLQGLNYILYPKLLKKFSVIESRSIAFKFYKKMIFLLLTFIAIFNSIIFIISTIFIQTWYIEYSYSIYIIFILYIGQLFNLIALYSNTISIAQNQEFFLIRLQIFSLFINILLSLIFIHFKLELYFMAIATVISQIILGIFSIGNTVKIIKLNGINE